MLSFGNVLRESKVKSIQLLEKSLEEILEVKTFLKKSIGFTECRSPEIELRFCSFLGCIYFSTTGTDKEK